MSSSVRSSSCMSSSPSMRSSRSLTLGSSGPSAFCNPSPSASRSRKYRLKRRSKVARSRDSLTSVAASVDLNVSRSVRPTSALAESASSASEGEMRISARRRSPMNSRMRWSIFDSLRGGRQHLIEGALDALEVLLVLHEHGERRLHEHGIELLGVEDDERARPVERLRHGRRLAQVEGADLLHGADDRLREALGDLRHLESDDGQFV